jgi:ferric-dicitrate binding protein FerR (iron transport regulator)
MKDETRPDPLERILKFAGRREPVDRQRTARVQDNVHERWHAMLGRRRASRRRRWLAWTGAGMAATAMALALISWLPRPGVEAPQVAAVVHVLGTPEAGARGRPMSPISAGIQLRAGSVVETGGGEAAALELDSGHALQVAANTRIRIESDALILDGGTIYLDTGNDHRATPIDVRSAIATVRESGTQYLVSLTGQSLEVSVREGSVRVIRGTNVDTAHAGEMLEVHTTGRPQRVPILTYGERWDWVTQLTSAPTLDGMNLSEFLQWLAREQGWRLDYESPKLARDAAGVELHGSIEGLSGEEALSAVMTSTGWRYRLEDGRLHIEHP